MLDQAMRKTIIDRLTCIAQPEKIILFGSYCRGTQNKDSDIDLLIIQSTNESPIKRSAAYRKALLDLGMSFDIIVRTPNEVKQWEGVKESFIHTVMSEGSVLYSRN